MIELLECSGITKDFLMPEFSNIADAVKKHYKLIH